MQAPSSPISPRRCTLVCPPAPHIPPHLFAIAQLIGSLEYYFLRSRRSGNGKAPPAGDPLGSLAHWADDARHQNEYTHIMGNIEPPPTPPLGGGLPCARACGAAEHTAPEAPAWRGAVRRAKATLDSFDVVGTTERCVPWSQRGEFTPSGHTETNEWRWRRAPRAVHQ